MNEQASIYVADPEALLDKARDCYRFAIQNGAIHHAEEALRTIGELDAAIKAASEESAKSRATESKKTDNSPAALMARLQGEYGLPRKPVAGLPPPPAPKPLPEGNSIRAILARAKAKHGAAD